MVSFDEQERLFNRFKLAQLDLQYMAAHFQNPIPAPKQVYQKSIKEIDEDFAIFRATMNTLIKDSKDFLTRLGQQGYAPELKTNKVGEETSWHPEPDDLPF